MKFFLKIFVLLVFVNLVLVPQIWSKTVTTSVQIKTIGPPSPPPGGGGGGYMPVNSQAIFTGYAYPYSKVVLLKDGNVAAAVSAGPDARFSINLDNLASGNYNFGIYSEDQNGLRSRTLNFVVTITSGVTTSVTGIYLPPTINLDKSEVKKGDIINILGQTLPEAEVSLVIHSPAEIVKKTQSDKSGVFTYKFNTLEIDYGEHQTKARSFKNDNYTEFSNEISFKVGNKSIFRNLKAPAKGDVNNDGRVNLVDFSVLAYWWKKPLTDWVKTNIDSKLFPDGKIDLKDFSILAYYWTG